VIPFDRDCFIRTLFAHAKLGCEEQLNANDRQSFQRPLSKLHGLYEICEHSEPHRSLGLYDHSNAKNKALSGHIMSTNLGFSGEVNSHPGDEENI
jgi:hypothetical protein